MNEGKEFEAVIYERKAGAVCPGCARKKPRITTTHDWEGNTRTRYHKCQDCSAAFKSIEEDASEKKPLEVETEPSPLNYGFRSDLKHPLKRN